jgi:hypothetical protein
VGLDLCQHIFFLRLFWEELDENLMACTEAL